MSPVNPDLEYLSTSIHRGDRNTDPPEAVMIVTTTNGTIRKCVLTLDDVAAVMHDSSRCLNILLKEQRRAAPTD